MLEIHGSDDESSLVLHHAAQPAPPARRVRRRIERPTDGEYAVFLIVVLPSRAYWLFMDPISCFVISLK
jgi:hypothetical protein